MGHSCDVGGRAHVVRYTFIMCLLALGLGTRASKKEEDQQREKRSYKGGLFMAIGHRNGLESFGSRNDDDEAVA